MGNIHEEWINAIEKILTEEKKELHYREIAKIIREKNLIPVNTKVKDMDKAVGGALSVDLEDELKSKFIRIKGRKGFYTLRRYDECNNFGLRWDLDKIDWKNFSGWEKSKDNCVNFNEQIGIYILYDDRGPIYVGRSMDDPIIKRLKDHTKDRHAGKWQKFSWFGLYPVDSNGKIVKINRSIDSNNKIISYLESVLIETLETRQNRKSGDFKGKEFKQI